MAIPVTLAVIPPHIVQATIEHTIEEFNVYDASAFTYCYHDIVKPLLQLCRSWRAIALPIICSSCRIAYSNEGTASFQYVVRRSQVMHQLDIHHCKFVQTVLIDIYIHHILNGTAGFNPKMQFAHAKSLGIGISFDKLTGLSKQLQERNTCNFVSQLQYMVPNCNKFHFAVNGPIPADVSISQNVVRMLVQHFADRNAQIQLEFNSIVEPYVVQGVHTMSNISLFACQWSKDYTNFAYLLRKNAPTLELIYINAHYPYGLSKLVFDSNHSPIKYPVLKKLIVSNHTPRELERIPANFQATPFPQLCQLELHNNFVFSDDMAFRGNSGSMVHLYLSLDSHALYVLNKHNILTKRKHACIERLTLNMNKVAHTVNLAAYNFRQIFGNLLSSAKIVCIGGHSLLDLLLQWLLKYNRCLDLRTLSSYLCNIPLLEAFSLLQRLPSLATFMAQISTPSPLDDKAAAWMYHHLSSQCTIASSSLEQLILKNFDNQPADRIAAIVILFAAMCPNLQFIQIYGESTAQPFNVYVWLLGQDHFPLLRKAISARQHFTLYGFNDMTYIKINRTPLLKK